MLVDMNKNFVILEEVRRLFLQSIHLVTVKRELISTPYPTKLQ